MILELILINGINNYSPLKAFVTWKYNTCLNNISVRYSEIRINCIQIKNVKNIVLYLKNRLNENFKQITSGLENISDQLVFVFQIIVPTVRQSCIHVFDTKNSHNCNNFIYICSSWLYWVVLFRQSEVGPESISN